MSDTKPKGPYGHSLLVEASILQNRWCAMTAKRFVRAAFTNPRPIAVGPGPGLFGD